MTHLYQRYKGFHAYKMDPKNRVSVLSSWRPEAGEPFFLMPSTEKDIPVVKVFTQEGYDEKVETVMASSKTPKEKKDILSVLASRMREATLNEQGKLLVPKELCDIAGLGAESDVYLVGRGDHFAVCSKPNFEKLFKAESAPVDDDLGIF